MHFTITVREGQTPGQNPQLESAWSKKKKTPQSASSSTKLRKQYITCIVHSAELYDQQSQTVTTFPGQRVYTVCSITNAQREIMRSKSKDTKHEYIGEERNKL